MVGDLREDGMPGQLARIEAADAVHDDAEEVRAEWQHAIELLDAAHAARG